MMYGKSFTFLNYLVHRNSKSSPGGRQSCLAASMIRSFRFLGARRRSKRMSRILGHILTQTEEGSA